MPSFNIAHTLKSLKTLSLEEQKLLLIEINGDSRVGAVNLKKKIKNNINSQIKESERLKKLAHYENSLHEIGFINIAGVDEAGRGPFAGPIVAAAVILPNNTLIKGLNDSKKLTHECREKLFEEITLKARAYKIKEFSNDVIDSDGLHNTNIRALREVALELSIAPDYVLVDGYNIDYFDIPSLRVIKGDQVSMSIAAASILAKVHRDKIMIKYHNQYPQYGFQTHKGYGSRSHIQAIEEHGTCPIHRKSFEPIKNFIK